MGATIDASPDALVPALFGEDQGRYIVTIAPGAAESLGAKAILAGVVATAIGTTGGNELKLGAARGIPVASLQKAHESWFPTFMAGYQN